MAIIGISGRIGSGKDTVGAIIRYLVWKKEVEAGDITGLYHTLQDFIDGRGAPSGWEIKKFAGKLKQIVSLLTGCKVSDLESQEFKSKEIGKDWIKWEIAWSDFADTLNLNEHYWSKVFANSEKEAHEFACLSGAKTIRYCREIKLTYRLLLQLIGTECMRGLIHENVWVNALFADYKPKYMVSSFPPPATEKEYVTQQGYPNWIITDMRFENEARAIKQRGGLLIRVERTPFTVHHSKTGERHDLSRDAFTEHPSETGLDNYQNFDCTVFNNGTIDDLVKSVETLLKDQGII